MDIKKDWYIIAIAYFMMVIILSVAVGIGVAQSSPAKPQETSPEPSISEPVTVVSVWYTKYPTENTLTFYSNGTYTSETLGAKSGEYEQSGNTIVITSNGVQGTATLDGNVLHVYSGESVIDYYSSKDAIPDETPATVFDELTTMRIHALRMMMCDGIWTSDSGETFSATLDSYTLNGSSTSYSFISSERDGDDSHNILKTDHGEVVMDVKLIDYTTMEYSVTIDGSTFHVDASMVETGI